MDIKRVIEIIKTERKCVKRNGMFDRACNRDCLNCDLVMESEEIIEAYDMALTILKVFDQIKWERDIAIEQLHELGYELGQKIEPCEDAVSRQAVINAIENDCMRGGLGSCFACYNDAQAFRGEIEKLPSVTQKSGYWIIDQKEGYKIWHCHCSKCNKDPQDFIGGSENWWVIRLSDFCPNCGCRMRGAENV